MMDRLVTEASTLQRTTFIRDNYLWHGRDSNPNSQQASGRYATRTGIWNNHAAELAGLSVPTYEQGDFCVQTVVRIPWPPCSILSSVRGCQACFDPHQIQKPIVAMGDHLKHILKKNLLLVEWDCDINVFGYKPCNQTAANCQHLQ
jgi:hypothetical protein